MMNKVEIDAQRIAYRAAGSGPPLVPLHGGLVDRRAWVRGIDPFSDDFHVVAWDAPGYGGSTDPPQDVDLGDYADSVAGLIDALELERAHVLGHSFGGGLALALYQRHPRLVRSMILVSAYAGWAGSLPAGEVEQRRQQARRNARRPIAEWIDEFLATLFDEATPPHLVAETRRIMLDTRPEGMLPMMNAFADAESLRSSMPTSRLVFVEGAGHDVNVEAPEIFDQEVRSFLCNV